MKKIFNVAIVGASGLIGRKFIEVLEKRRFPVGEIKLFASEKSRGKKMTAFGRSIELKTLDENSFKGTDIVFFSAGKNVALKYAPIAESQGAFVIDNSSAFRQNPDTALIIPEINGKSLNQYKNKIISNPNCSTAIALLPLFYLHKRYRLKRVIYTTYQGISGSGQRGIDDYKRCENGLIAQFFPINPTKNCIPKIGGFSKYGYTEEELKMVFETQKILGLTLPVSATCVRVPVLNCHAVSVDAEFEKEIYDEDVKSILKNAQGVRLADLPCQTLADGKDEILVGRIKRSFAFNNGLSFYCVGDNTLKGASLNAVQIAELLINSGRLC
ncbi:MAG: aspartate-semialdehyde dehydrogenase [Clostridia bacterium]|nr:aspartate-semialdehyde dehydrogenase [Clostridia bacterium]